MTSIEITSLNKKLEMQNDPKKVEIISADSFALTTGAKTDLYNSADGEGHIANMPMVLMPAVPSFVLTARIQSDLINKFDAGSIVLYSDNNHWVKFLFEKDYFDRLIVGSAVTRDFSDDNIHKEVTNKDIYLRMACVDEKLVSLYISENGKEWQYLRVFRLPEGHTWKVGFGAQSPLGEECRVLFSDIVYKTEAYEDFWTGE